MRATNKMLKKPPQTKTNHRNEWDNIAQILIIHPVQWDWLFSAFYHKFSRLMKINDFVHSPTMQIFIHIFIHFSGEISLYGVRRSVTMCYAMFLVWIHFFFCITSHLFWFQVVAVETCIRWLFYVLCLCIMRWQTANGKKKREIMKLYVLGENKKNHERYFVGNGNTYESLKHFMIRIHIHFYPWLMLVILIHSIAPTVPIP